MHCALIYLLVRWHGYGRVVRLYSRGPLDQNIALQEDVLIKTLLFYQNVENSKQIFDQSSFHDQPLGRVLVDCRNVLNYLTGLNSLLHTVLT